MKLDTVTTYGELMEIVNSHEIVLACFVADWCEPCTPMKDELDKLYEELQSIAKMVAIPVDQSKEIALREDVQGVPTIICYKKGKEKDRIGGYKQASAVRKLLKI